MQKLDVVEGYGPKGLIKAVRNATWTASDYDSACYFMGIDFRNILLFKEKDLVNSQKYRVVFYEVPEGSGDSVSVEGYQEQNFIENLEIAPMPVVFVEALILDHDNHMFATAYRLRVEKF